MPHSVSAEAEHQHAVRSQGLLEPVDRALDRLTVEVDQHVPANDQVEAVFSERWDRVVRKVVGREAHEPAQALADEELVTLRLEVSPALGRRASGTASAMAFITAASEAVVPASPTPLTPSALLRHGTGWTALPSNGTSPARGFA